jgi:hypothetical protein
MEAISSSETSVYTRSARRHISEDGILQHNLKLQKNPLFPAGYNENTSFGSESESLAFAKEPSSIAN